MDKLRRKLFVHLDTTAWVGEGLSPLNKAISLLILVSSVVVIAEIESTIYSPFSQAFVAVDLAVAFLFLIEYLARLWVMGEDLRYRGFFGRLRYAVTPTVVIDLMAILPFLLGIGGSDAFLLRGLRLLRIFSLAKLGRFSEALRQLAGAIAKRRHELTISLGFAAVILLASATVMYLVEGATQPEAFGSIPRALWWAIVTLSTVGYGDIYPITPLGKVFAGITALAAIGLIAMPTGILAAAFSDAFQRSTVAAGSAKADIN